MSKGDDLLTFMSDGNDRRLERAAPEEKEAPRCGGTKWFCKWCRCPCEMHDSRVSCPGCPACTPRSETDGGLLGDLEVAATHAAVCGLNPERAARLRQLRERLEAFKREYHDTDRGLFGDKWVALIDLLTEAVR